jgi:hypothetical protein
MARTAIITNRDAAGVARRRTGDAGCKVALAIASGAMSPAPDERRRHRCAHDEARVNALNH